MIEVKYKFSTPTAPGRHPIPRDRATVPRLAHTAALAIPVERTGFASELGERRSVVANNHYIFFWLSGTCRVLNSGRHRTHMVGEWVVGG